MDDLRVRRGLVARILALLTAKGVHREGRGVEARHMYYSNFDVLSPRELEELLPEDAVPEELNFQDIDEELPAVGLSRSMFVDWLVEGRQDCDVARALGQLWVRELRGGANESAEDYFQGL